MKTYRDRPDPLRRHASPLLVFGVAGRIGSGASFVSEGLKEELASYGYVVVKIKVTKDYLDDSAWNGYAPSVSPEGPNGPAPRTPLPLVAESRPIVKTVLNDEIQKILDRLGLKDGDLSPAGQRIVELQRKGNEIRQKFGTNIIAARSIDSIARDMERRKAMDQTLVRVAYIIDSLKHPDEIDLLRTVFGDAFCMVGAVADDSVRRRRLQDQKHITDREFEAISEIDADEKLEYGQHTADAILESDYFFENNSATPDKIPQECRRLLNLLFQSAVVTPRQDEYGMHLAVMAADKSACLSRQVGAAIISATGTVLATGCNDVPQFGGGLYTSESDPDNRCFAKSMMCHNDNEKRIIAEEIVRVLRIEGVTGISDTQYEEIKRILLKKTRLRLLIEFSRAVHAEMDAIIAVARGGLPGLVGSTMYVTTYPCHNCAKHIIDAGIQRVVFIEPYVKSLAQKLHADAINNPLEEPSPRKVSFVNYGGVSPLRYAQVFSMHGERKSDAKLIRYSLQKTELLPLSAQEVPVLISRLEQFQSWFNQFRVPTSVANAG